ncbi:27-O-demethylrifamycin SV methyltransferase [Streptosporangium oxazolinicum]|uniref:27-O-demethylrifamycin SV methyltransferase n=1 Tax=Streptosporangium oxazolinicum TaxID=909287 RepID=A0ABP8B463_9ACTN
MESIGAANIGTHYDERSPIADELRDGQVHMWYWYDEQDEATLTEAVRRITRKVTDTLGLRSGERLLDAGCGPGETGVFLARRYGARVTGITLSAYEIERANERAASNGMEELARFQYGDYMELPFPDGSFDAVLALESLQNAPDPVRVFAEFFRVLRPGGRIAFSDFSLESSAEPKRLATFMSALKLPRLPTLREWLEYAGDAGFEVEEYTQCGPRVFGRRSKYVKAAMSRRQELLAKFGEEALGEFASRHLGFFAPRRDQVGYVIVAARKPRG